MAMNKSNITGDNQQFVRYVAIGVLAVAAFFGAYKYARASSVDAQTVSQNGVLTANGGYGSGGAGGAGGGGGCCGGGGGAAGGGGGGAAGGGGGCCGGGGGSNQTVAGKTTVSGNVQKVTIDLTTGSYSPNQISAKAGVPLELDFKGPASGCNGYVVSQQLGFQQDVSNGGTIQVPALQPGTYTFTCSMGMYVAQIVVK